ncbi:MAG: leucine-rich repeat protein, partial [bacterium]|nr:leucine-rich repeat protein [bacterium]
SIDIPEGLEYLGEGVFSACPSFVYDDSGATFEGDARKILIRLQPMLSAATYEVPSSVRFIQSRAFHTCSRLVELTLNDGLLAIGKEAFYNCSSLTSLTLPESLRWLDDGAFAGCQWLKAITFQGPPPRMREPFSNRTIFNSEDTASTKLYDCEVRKVYYPAKYATAWQHQIDAGKWSQVIPVATADVLISLQTLGGGTITPAEGDLYGFANGTTKTLTATPAEGYLFMGWSGDVVSDQSTITLTDEKSFYRLCAQFLPLSSIEAYLQSVGGAGGLSLQAVETLLSEKIAQGALVTLETATDAAKREAEATLQEKIESKEILTQAQIDDLSMQTPVLDLREGEATLSLTLQKATHLTSNAWEKVKLKAADVDEEGNLFLTLTPEEDEDTVFYKFVVPNEQF